MKTFTFVFFFLLGSLFLQGQIHKVLSYKFNNTLAESKGNGPVLVNLDTTGTFVTDTLSRISGLTKTVYRFKNNCGFQFNNVLASNFVDSTYSIELYFKFDYVNGWRRVIDWKNRTTDEGAYVYYGDVSFYDFGTSDSTTVVAGQYTHFVFTRNKTTNMVRIYSDGKPELNIADVDYQAMIDTSHVLNFFRDDLQVTNESSSGAIAMLNIYNYLLDSVSVQQKFDSLHGVLFSVRELENSNLPVRVYPNPAKDKISIDLSRIPGSVPVTVSMFSSTGSVVYSRACQSGITYPVDLKTLELPDGIYIVKVDSGKEIYNRKVVIIR
jgi:hypothetical protein